MPTHQNQKILGEWKFLQSEELIQRQSIQIWRLHSAAANLFESTRWCWKNGHARSKPGRRNCFFFIAQKQHADDAAIWYESVRLMVPPDWLGTTQEKCSKLSAIINLSVLTIMEGINQRSCQKVAMLMGKSKKHCLLFRRFLTRNEEEQGCNGRQEGHGYWNLKEKSVKSPKEVALKAA